MANIEMSMYDIHKQLYATKMEPLEADKLKTKMASIGSWFSTNPMQNRYGLLCREKYDFTVFEFHNMNYNRGMELVQEVLENRGQIMDICYVHETNAYECWIKYDDDVVMYLLFECDWVVDVE